VTYTSFATSLQTQLLNGYNINVPPQDATRSPQRVTTSTAGTDVELQMNVFKVQSVEAASGRMSIKVWMRFRWTDERLAWNVTAHGGVTTVSFATNPERQEIWIPDIQPYNTYDSIAQTLDYTDARVRYDGQVYWSRPGLVNIMCKFSGLVKFPFDVLKCSMEVGGWSWSESHQGIDLFSTGGAVFSSEQTSLPSYTEVRRPTPPPPPALYFRPRSARAAAVSAAAVRRPHHTALHTALHDASCRRPRPRPRTTNSSSPLTADPDPHPHPHPPRSTKSRRSGGSARCTSTSAALLSRGQ
jgi:hypothetical protein